jgi:EAL domain-containing protein (putative c-di-GMP-specific phosphodiesterase class I)
VRCARETVEHADRASLSLCAEGDMSARPIVKVVAVDDHEMMLQSVVRVLVADPCIDVVGTAVTGAQGIELVQLLQPDVLVIDYHLPDMDAPEAIRRIRESNLDTRVITISGSGRPGALYASIRAGSSAWVSKTRTIHDLRDAIHSVAAGSTYANDEMDGLPATDDLVVHYQPVVDLHDGHVVGFEALVRWQHPERGLLYPDSFLAYAEETGHVEVIDKWVRETAVRQLSKWQHQFPVDPPLWMSVNVSTSDLLDPGLFRSFSETLAAADVEPRTLVVEITESVLMNDSQSTMDFLVSLHEIGVKLALDDFGTGFSSVSYIRRFPFDHLKIDMSFTAEITSSLRSKILVEEIYHMIEALSMTGIVEGIETDAQLTALTDIGFEFGQGFLFSHGLSAPECQALLSRASLLPQLSGEGRPA